jgi:bacillithiol system protein YtxJ
MTDNLRELTKIEELEDLLVQSKDHPVLIFKHSLTCPISSDAFEEFQRYLCNPAAGISYSVITVQNSRDVSDEAARKLGIEHESPQAILVVNGSGIWSASHFRITSEAIHAAISQAIE